MLGAREGGTSRIEPDQFASGDELTNAFSGVTLSVVDSDGRTSTGETVRAQSSGLASTGNLVFARGTSTTFNSSSSWLRADFDLPTAEVSIDVIGDDSNDPGILQAYDASGNLIEQVTGFNTAT